ncbi:hypothetical protein N2152v2_005038 [Parachlorella kessleri]
MPKLSTYVQQLQQQEKEQAPEGPVAAQRPGVASACHPRSPEKVGDPAEAVKPAPFGQQLSPSYAAAASKLKVDFDKRVANHGPRVYRWPDGKLRPEKPPANHYAAANRQKWQQLVEHCRTHGGDRSYDRHGYSLRYGINVNPGDHEDYLQSIGLEAEADQQGRQQGWQQDGVQNPLDDPFHCFNTFYAGGAAAVFKHRRGRLL